MNRVLGLRGVMAPVWRSPATVWNSIWDSEPKTYFTYTPQVSQVLDREPKWVTADEAVRCIKSGIIVFFPLF